MTKRGPTKFEGNWKISNTKRAGQADCHKTNKQTKNSQRVITRHRLQHDVDAFLRRRQQTEERLKEEEESARKRKAEEEARVVLEERKLVLVQRRLESLRLLDAVFERVKVFSMGIV